ncbi:MAG TPA: long-chain fatty acid--CoA ligase [Chloroflexota bacterium]|nr:long-chain fatty acid--CoA ligase [Chloroflexota bacterium]
MATEIGSRPWLKHYPTEIPTTLDYRSVPLFTLLEESAAKHPDLPAVRFYTHTLTYAEVWGRAQRFAAALAEMGVKQGDRVALMLPNCPQYVIAYFGVLRAGGVIAQVNPLYTARELAHVLADSGAQTIVVADALYPVVQAAAVPLARVLVATLKGDVPLGPAAQRFEDVLAKTTAAPPVVSINPREDVAALQYTGGTTGVSKAAMLTHFNLVANVQQIRAWNPSGGPPGTERMLTVIPLFHAYGMTVGMNFPIAAGYEIILLPRFDLKEVMETIKATQPTYFPGVPTMYVAVLNFPNAAAYGVSSIKYCNSGAAPLPVEVIQSFAQQFGGRLREGYGLSETSPVSHGCPFLLESRPGTVGIPLPDTDCEIVDIETGLHVLPPGEIGELRIRGPQVMKGYWNRSDETAIALRDGWLYTGDLGTMGDDGFFSIVDRKKDMIIASGYNVYPRDVEEILYEHPAVLECCVAGIPDTYRGETIKAYVVTRPGTEVTAEALDAFCRERLAPFKVPRLYEFRETLPKSAVGKVLRRALVAGEQPTS